MSQRQLQLNPDLRPATWEEIKAYRDAFEISPITIDDERTFDYNEKAMERMSRTASNWASADKEADGTLGWKMADNNYTFLTEMDLNAIISELDSKQVNRASKLHKQAEVFKLTNATLGTVKDINNWGL